MRSTYSELTGAIYLGILLEEARTNTCLWNRDFTNAAWVMTTMTPLKDQTGIDGAANAASSLLATGANATAKQTITLAAVNRPFSVFVKRLTGTGNIDLAQDGAAFTTKAVANDGLWHRISLVASQLNPVLSIRLATNGDKIAVDYAALEDNAGAAATFETSPIATTTLAVTRNADVSSIPTAGNMLGTVGTAYAEITGPVASGYIMQSGQIPLYMDSGTQIRCYDGTTISAGALITPSRTVPQKVASRWGGNVTTFVGGAPATSTAFDGDLNLGANIFFGSNGGINVFLNGTIKNAKVWGRAVGDAQIGAQ